MRRWQEDKDFTTELLECKGTILEVTVDSECFIYFIENQESGADNLILIYEYDQKECIVVFDREVQDVLQDIVDDAMGNSNNNKVRVKDNTTDRIKTDLDLSEYDVVDEYF